MACIGLIDVDGHNFPNLALMKLSAYHKAIGDTVEWVNPLFGKYDRVYKAKVFDFTPDFNTVINAGEIIKGGTGYDLQNKLPPEIECQCPDYSIYNIADTAYGFLTRGCPRGCKFCIVGEKEGLKSIQVAELDQFWQGQKEIKLLDPNLLACKDSTYLLNQLKNSGAWIDFTQGLDIRLMNDEFVRLINGLKVKMIHFAWDNYEFKTYEKLKKYRKQFDYDGRKLRVYVLVNFDTVLEQDLERIYKLKELDYDPYVMVFNKQSAPRVIKKLQRWVNNKYIFRSKGAEKFEDYLKIGEIKNA
jgi:hypothetical protein